MVLENPPTTRRKFTDIVFIPILIGTTIWSILVALYTWVVLLYDNLTPILFLSLLAVGGTGWGYYSTTVVIDVYYLWECKLVPIWTNYFEPFMASIVVIWDGGACWWNAFGEAQRLLSGKLLWNIYVHCTNGFSVWKMLIHVLSSFIYLVSTYLTWFFVGNPISSVLPLYPWYKYTVLIIIDLGMMINCACESLYIFTTVLSRVIQSNNLSCALHQFSNVPIDVLQVIVQFGLNMIQLIFYVVAHHLTPTYVVEVLSGEVPSSPAAFELPNFTAATERCSVGFYYAGLFLNDALQTIICTAQSEPSSNGNKTLGTVLYLECMAGNATYVDLFGFLGPLGGGFYRFERVTIQLFLNTGTILSELKNQPPGPWFLTDVWEVDQFYDTMRYPPPGYSYCANPNFPVFVPGSNRSAIVPPQPILYGNYTSPFDVSCSSATTSRFVIPCSNCSEVEQYDLEQQLCLAAQGLDNLLLNVVPFTIFQGTLCCATGKTIRIMTALLKFVQGLASHIIMFPRFGEFITDQNNFDVVFNEFMGQYDEIGGILTCPAIILDGFNPKLVCLATILVNLVKPVGETIRLFVDIPVRALNNVYNTGCLGIFQVVCTSNQTTCWDLNVRVYDYLRKPRNDVVSVYEYDNGTIYSLPDYRDLYLPINESYPTAWIDCFCELLTFDFLNQFQSNPSTFLPDLCCGLEFAFRFVVETIHFLSETVFSMFETFRGIFQPSAPLNLTFLAYLSCYTEFNCAPIPQMLSDVADFLDCPCVIVHALNQGINPSKDSLPCICEFFTSIGNFIYHIISAGSLAAQVVVQVLDCLFNISPPFSAEPFCTTYLEDRVNQFFADIKLAYADVCAFIASIGCSLGLLFRFDCIGTRYYSPPDYPTCNGGSVYGVCAPSDRLSILFDRACLVLLAIPGFLTRIIESFAVTAFGQAFSGFSNLSNLVYQLLISAFAPFVGTPAFTTNNGTYVPATSGLLQAFGLTVNCFAGPPIQACMDEVAPSSGGNCIGDLAVALGDALATILNDLSLILASFVGIIGDVIGGNGAQLSTDIVNFIEGLLNLLVDVFGNLQQLIQVAINSIVGVVSFFFGTGVGLIIKFVLELATSVAQALLAIINAALSLFFGGTGKRFFGDGYGKDDDDDGYINNVVRGSYGMSPEDMTGKIKAMWKDDPSRFLKYSFALHFGTQSAARHRTDYQNQKRESNASTSEDENSADYFTNFTASTSFSDKVDVMYDAFPTGSYCEDVMKSFQDSGYTSIDQLTIVEKPLWYGCYLSYIVPLGFNLLSNRSNTYADGGNVIPTVPKDFLYNYSSFFNVVSDIFGTIHLYTGYVANYNDLAGYSSDIVSFENLATGNGGALTQDQYAILYGKRKRTVPWYGINNEDDFYINSLFANGSHLTDGFQLIDGFNGSNASTLTVNGRYPVYLSNFTFAQYLIYKGYVSDTSKHLASILSSYSKATRENTILGLHSTFTNLYNAYTSSPSSSSSSSSTPSLFSSYYQQYYASNEGKKRERGDTSFLFEEYDPTMPTMEQERKIRWSMDGETASPAHEKVRSRRREAIDGVKGFPFYRFFFDTIPATVGSLFRRAWGTENVKEILFEHYLRKRFSNPNIDITDASSEHSRDRRRFSAYVNDSNLGDLRGEYEERLKNMPFSPSYKTYDNDESYAALKRFEEEYGEAKRLHGINDGETNLFFHRWGMIKNAYQLAVDSLSSHLTLESMGKRLRETVLHKYAKMYSDSIRGNGNGNKRSNGAVATGSTIRDTYVVLRNYYDKFRSKFPKDPLPPCETEICSEGRSRYDEMVETVDSFIMNGHYSYDDDYLLYGSDVQWASKKRQSEMEVAEPLIPLCYPLKSQLGCQFCDSCAEDECYDCQLCNNCTTFENGDTLCSTCGTCSIGGPMCTGGCGLCRQCTVSGTCLNCIILDIIFSLLIDRAEYCAALARGDTSVIKRPPPNSTLIKIFYFNETLNSTPSSNSSLVPSGNAGAGTICSNPIANLVYCDVISKITNLDFLTTAVYFVQNTNTNPFNATFNWIGGWFWIKYRSTPVSLPWIRQCNWDIDLPCVFGRDLREALKIGAIIVLVLAVLAWFLFPPAAGIINAAVGGNWFVFYWTLVISIAWFYSPFCFTSLSTFFYSYVQFLFLGCPLVPLVPLCAANQTYDVLNSTFAPCAITLPSCLVVEGTSTCPTCPNKGQLYSPQANGFTNPFVEIGYVLQRYALPFYSFMNHTCLVRGECFWGYPGANIGPLYPFWAEMFNITYFSNGIATPQTKKLDCLFYLQLPELLAFPAVLVLSYFPLILLGSVFLILWAFVLRWFSLWPFYILVPRPVSSFMKLYPSPFVGGGGPGSPSSQSSLNVQISEKAYKKKAKSGKYRKNKGDGENETPAPVEGSFPLPYYETSEHVKSNRANRRLRRKLDKSKYNAIANRALASGDNITQMLYGAISSVYSFVDSAISYFKGRDRGLVENNDDYDDDDDDDDNSDSDDDNARIASEARTETRSGRKHSLGHDARSRLRLDRGTTDATTTTATTTATTGSSKIPKRREETKKSK